jgi:hypothetical protein
MLPDRVSLLRDASFEFDGAVAADKRQRLSSPKPAPEGASHALGGEVESRSESPRRTGSPVSGPGGGERVGVVGRGGGGGAGGRSFSPGFGTPVVGVQRGKSPVRPLSPPLASSPLELQYRKAEARHGWWREGKIFLGQGAFLERFWGGVKSGGFFSQAVGGGEEGRVGFGRGGGAVVKGGRGVEWREKVRIAAGSWSVGVLLGVLLRSGNMCRFLRELEGGYARALLWCSNLLGTSFLLRHGVVGHTWKMVMSGAMAAVVGVGRRWQRGKGGQRASQRPMTQAHILKRAPSSEFI